MKIRRILATAVAAAVTTPVVFLSAAPAFADTKPAPASTQKPAPGEEDPDFDEYEKLVAAVTEAEEKVDALEKQRKTLVTELRNMKLDEALATELAEAWKALVAAKAAKKDADEKLVKAEEALAAATPEQKEAAEKAVADAKTAVEEAAATLTAAELRNKKAGEAAKPFDDARVALSQKISLLDVDLTLARTDLAEAEKALEEFEEGGFDDCEEDDSLKVALTGPKAVTAGKSASFSLRVSNTSERTLEDVEAFVDAVRFPEPGELIDDETDFSKRIIPVEWSSADNLEWTPFTEEFDSIEIGKLVKGGHYDVKLRLTVPADAAPGKGAAFSFAGYGQMDEECGGEQFAQVDFDILAAKTDKPKPTPEPTPSETTATPTPAPTTGGNDNTTQQGGSSNTPVKGSLAATGANENLTRLGLAAAATVALGAGALVIARRRKAGADA
ncbi:peptidase [Streptomyces sp. NPDC056480]|uniref:peptidase n=1 Tax=Streptomyces sp. NPDC056480 TaxID=3345833 RepID=UPI0036A8CB22